MDFLLGNSGSYLIFFLAGSSPVEVLCKVWWMHMFSFQLGATGTTPAKREPLNHIALLPLNGDDQLSAGPAGSRERREPTRLTSCLVGMAGVEA